MKFSSKRRLYAEGLEARQLLAGDLAQTCADTPYLIGDANYDGRFDQKDIIEVFQVGKYETGAAANWQQGDWNNDKLFDSADLTVALQSGNYLAEPDEIRQQMWPDVISLPIGFEPKDIEVGQGSDFFVGAFSWSSLLGPRVGLDHPVSSLAGAIYKGNLCTGEGDILVPSSADNPRPVLGLSYDSRTDYLYAAVGDPATPDGRPNQGIAVYNGTTGELIDQITIGDGPFMSNVLVTESAVFATTTNRGVLFKIPLDAGGKLPSQLTFETIELTGFEPANGFYAWGIAGDDQDLIVLNGLNGSGVLYRVNPTTGASTPITIQGAQQTFELGDELYLSDRTLYIAQTFANSVAVVQLSDDLTEGMFVETIECDECRIPHNIAVLGDSIYAVSSNVLFDPDAAAEDRIFGDSAQVQSVVVKLPKVAEEVNLWPDVISLPIGLEPKDIEVGQGSDFFVGAFSWSSLLGPRVGLEHPVSSLAGAIYKGNLSTGEGNILVPSSADNPRPVLGLSYDSRTDYLYAAVGDPAKPDGRPNQGIAVYNGTTGELIDQITIGDGPFMSNVLVTESAVFATTTNRGVLFKIPLDAGGKLPSQLTFETIELTGFEPANGFYAWGIAGDDQDLIVLNGLNGSGVLYRVNPTTGASTPITIQGAQQTFELGDELYLSDRTLYIAQTFANSVAVVQLSDDLTEGTFVKTIECGECRIPHNLAVLGDSIYAVSSNVLFDPDAAAEDRIFGDSAQVQSVVVKLPK